MLPRIRSFLIIGGIALHGIFYSVWAHAEIEVVEGEPVVVTEESRSISTRKPVTKKPSQTKNAQNTSSVSTELYIQMQAMREELMQLRGMVEQQNFELEQLRQRRKEDYLDFDRRISDLSTDRPSAARKTSNQTTKPKVPNTVLVDPLPKTTTKSTAKPATAKKTTSSHKPSAATQVHIGNDIVRGDTEEYKAAYQLIKDQKYPEAKQDLNRFVSRHPKSQYIPSARFWLGELYYIDSELEKSKESFIILIERFPDYRRVADAKFKLGRIYHQTGNNSKARTLLQSVIADHADSKAANPAREYLQNNLQ